MSMATRCDVPGCGRFSIDYNYAGWKRVSIRVMGLDGGYGENVEKDLCPDHAAFAERALEDLKKKLSGES